MRKFIVLVSMALMTLACGKEDIPTINYPACDYFPLQVGNKWYYEGYTSEITGKETWNGLEWYVLMSVYERDNGVENIYKMYYRKTADDKVYRKTDESSEAILLIDLKIGFNQSCKYTIGENQWTVTTGDDFETFKINDIEIPNCRSYYYDIPRAVDDEYLMTLAPGLGLLAHVSLAWGLGDTLQRAVINGLEIHISE